MPRRRPAGRERFRGGRDIALKPKVSVVMSAFNAEAFIEEAIISILSQTYENVELVIADDGSMDNTRRVLDRLTDRRIRRYDNKENLGYLRTRNRLFRLTTGEFVTLQDADDISLPNRIENQVGAFLADP